MLGIRLLLLRIHFFFSHLLLTVIGVYFFTLEAICRACRDTEPLSQRFCARVYIDVFVCVLLLFLCIYFSFLACRISLAVSIIMTTTTKTVSWIPTDCFTFRLLFFFLLRAIPMC